MVEQTVKRFENCYICLDTIHERADVTDGQTYADGRTNIGRQHWSPKSYAAATFPRQMRRLFLRMRGISKESITIVLNSNKRKQ